MSKFSTYIIQYITPRYANQQTTTTKKALWVHAFVWCAVVKPSESVVFWDVWVEELERILWNNPIRDDLVVPYDVSEWKGIQAALGIRLH